MAAETNRLDRWLSRVLGDLTDAGPVIRVELWHSVEGEENERLESWRFDEKGMSAAELSAMLRDAASGDAETRTGNPQRYVAFAFRKEDEDEHDSTCAFICRSNQKNFGENSDPGTDKGVAGVMLRHTEALHRQLIGNSERLSQELERERLSRMRAEEQSFAFFEKYQELLNLESERRVKEAKEMLQARRIDQLMGAGTAILPLLMAKLAGPNGPSMLLPSGTTPRDLAMRKLLSNLTTAETEAIFAGLSSDNRLAMLEVYQSYKEDEQAENAMKPDILREPSEDTPRH